MKKRLVMLSLAIVLSLSGCGNNFAESEEKLQTETTKEVANEAESENEAEANEEIEETKEVEEVVEKVVPDNHDGSTYTDWKTLQPYDETFLKYRLPDNYIWYPGAGSGIFSSNIEEDMKENKGMWARDIDIADEDLASWRDLQCYYARFFIAQTNRWVEIRVYDPERGVKTTAADSIESFNKVPDMSAEYIDMVNGENTKWDLVCLHDRPTNGDIPTNHYYAIDHDNPDKSIEFENYVDRMGTYSEEVLAKNDYREWTEDEVREFLETCTY